MTEQADLTAPRTRNPWGQGEKLRTEILAAAARLLSELGSEEGLSIRGVARAVGIAPASIYQHFEDKAELVRGLVNYDYELLGTQMQAADESVPAALPIKDVPVARLRAQMGAYCQFAIDNPGHYRLIYNNRERGGEPGKSPLGRIVGQIVNALQRCEAAGLELRQPAQRAAITVFVGAHGRVALYHAAPEAGDGAAGIYSFVDDLISLVFADQV
jgi:AcrR family transcriptional regulator